VPLTLTIIPALTVSVGGRNYASPRSAIEEIVRSRNDSVKIESIGGTRVAGIRDKRIPLVSLGETLGVEEGCAVADQSLIVLKPAGGDVYALAVDLVHDHEELVVKPAAPVVMATGLYAGTTLADDGSPILLLDPSGIAASAGVVLDQNEIDKLAAKPVAEADTRDEAPALLFRTLDGAKRVIRLAVVERIEDVPADAIKHSAGRMRVAIGERILPLAGCAEKPRDSIRVLRLSDGVTELAYGFAEVIDLVSLGSDLQPASQLGEVAGVTLIAGDQVEVVDTYWLFGAHGNGGAAEKAKPVCALPRDDGWMEHILRPIVESAGYRVIAADDAKAAEADVLIASAEADVPVLGTGKVLKIRAELDPAHENDDSIYRYDRAGLLSALSSRAAARGKDGQ
jgi:two-component system chemotaxis sensor kinase CheA